MLYPIMLDIENRCCLVAGGGPVAARKARELVKCGARVRIVSPTLCDELREKLAEGSVEWIKDCYKASYLEDVLLCFACTDDAETNRRIAQDANTRNIMVNGAEGGSSSFIVPSVRRRGDITLAVSCDENPAASRYTADFFENRVEAWLVDYIHAVKEIRMECKKRITHGETRQAFIKGLFDAEMLALAGRSTAAAREKAMERLAALCRGRIDGNDRTD